MDIWNEEKKMNWITSKRKMRKKNYMEWKKAIQNWMDKLQNQGYGNYMKLVPVLLAYGGSPGERSEKFGGRLF